MAEELLEAKAAEAEAMLELLQESYADLQAALMQDDRGWSRFENQGNGGWSFELLSRKAEECEQAAALNPLIKRGLMLRAAYVWGGNEGVRITVRDEATSGQDVNGIVQAFLKDRSARLVAEIQGQTKLENMLGTSGEVYLCLPTDPMTGRVQVRTIPMRQVPVIISDPEDEDTHWYYLRQWIVRGEARKAFYPALHYSPAKKPARSDESFGTGLDGIPIKWGQPVYRVGVNEVRGRGMGDAFAALPWAYAYKQFLEAWHKLMRSLATFAWLAKTRGDKAGQVAQNILQQTANQNAIGAAAVVDPNTRLEAISKSGAAFDAESGRPIAGMVASAMGVPITLLLADPGVTGARAVAETMTEPTRLEFQLRRAVWSEALRDILNYVIDQAVIAPAGKLRGKSVQHPDRVEVTLKKVDNRTVIIDWPTFENTPVDVLVSAIAKANEQEVVPHVVIARMLLTALGWSNIDEVMDKITDAEGNFLQPKEIAAKMNKDSGTGSDTDTKIGDAEDA